ncbi:hypothetical protein ACTQ6A_12195 [Lachnospiraceae bacterium LCP25S3_G4]
MHDTDSLDEFYESIWKLYSIKKGKGSVSEIQKKKLQKIDFEELERCVERFVDDMQMEKREKRKYVF